MGKWAGIVVSFVFASSVAPFHLAMSALAREPNIESASVGLVYFGVAFLTFLSFSIIAGLLVGVPCYLVCQRLNLVTWWTATLVGSVAGVFAALSFPGNEPLQVRLLIYAMLGAISGLVFWAASTIAANDR